MATASAALVKHLEATTTAGDWTDVLAVGKYADDMADRYLRELADSVTM
jgi:hypothetical protein